MFVCVWEIVKEAQKGKGVQEAESRGWGQAWGTQCARRGRFEKA